jgi:hypothetical protein
MTTRPAMCNGVLGERVRWVFVAGLTMVACTRAAPPVRQEGIWLDDATMQRLGIAVGAAEVHDVDDTLTHAGDVMPPSQTGNVPVLFDVTLRELGSIAIGTQARATVAGAGAPFEGSVEWTGAAVDGRQMVRVRCGFADRGELLANARHARVELVLGHHPAIAVPRTALLRAGSAVVLFAETERQGHRSRFMSMPVGVEEETSMAWVPSPHGIEPGTRVIVRGAEALAREIGDPSL